MEIKVKYTSVDGFREQQTFRTIKGARTYARKWVGESPEIGTRYAVSGDGVGKIEVSGCSMLNLFHTPANEHRFYPITEQDAFIRSRDGWTWNEGCECGETRVMGEGSPASQRAYEREQARCEADFRTWYAASGVVAMSRETQSEWRHDELPF